MYVLSDVHKAFAVKDIYVLTSLHACCRPRHLRLGAFGRVESVCSHVFMYVHGM
jgi:hypothetical protein